MVRESLALSLGRVHHYSSFFFFFEKGWTTVAEHEPLVVSSVFVLDESSLSRCIYYS